MFRRARLAELAAMCRRAPMAVYARSSGRCATARSPAAAGWPATWREATRPWPAPAARPTAAVAPLSFHNRRGMTLSERLQTLLRIKQWSLADLEHASGVSKGYLAQMTRAEHANPSLETLRSLAGAFGTTIAEIV